MSAYERQRAANIARNQSALDKLGLGGTKVNEGGKGGKKKAATK